MGYPTYVAANITCKGTFYAPLFLTAARTGKLISRPGAQNISVSDNMLPVPFIVEIPCTVIQNPAPSFIMQFGHGLFGSFNAGIIFDFIRRQN